MGIGLGLLRRILIWGILDGVMSAAAFFVNDDYLISWKGRTYVRGLLLLLLLLTTVSFKGFVDESMGG